MELGDEKIEFNFHDAMKYTLSITCYDQVDNCVQHIFYFDYEDKLCVVLSYDCDFTEIEEMKRNIYVP